MFQICNGLAKINFSVFTIFFGQNFALGDFSLFHSAETPFFTINALGSIIIPSKYVYSFKLREFFLSNDVLTSLSWG